MSRSGRAGMSVCAALAVVAAWSGIGCEKAADEVPAQTQPAIVKTETGEMVLVPTGSFTMGSDKGEPDEQPTRTVQMDAFLIDKCEVTQAQFMAIREKDTSHFKNPENPAEQVGWAEAAFYCNARSRAEGLTPCYDEETGACNFDADGYRLPTEAEWEYACRAGSDSAYPFGNNPAELKQYAWFSENAGDKPHPVGTKRPNAWGIHDLCGNVMEWCNDAYEAEYYKTAPAENPRGPEETLDSTFLLRGGAWSSSADACRPAYRAHESPGQPDACFAHDDIGFRCVRKAPTESEE